MFNLGDSFFKILLRSTSNYANFQAVVNAQENTGLVHLIIIQYKEENFYNSGCFKSKTILSAPHHTKFFNIADN